MRAGLAYARMPAWAFRSVWANLDISNMGMSELAEFHEPKVKMIPAPEWTPADLKKVIVLEI